MVSLNHHLYITALDMIEHKTKFVYHLKTIQTAYFISIKAVLSHTIHVLSLSLKSQIYLQMSHLYLISIFNYTVLTLTSVPILPGSHAHIHIQHTGM